MTKKQRTERMRTLGMTFLLLHESQPKSKVDMDNPCWEPCGTVACHAGWFAVARNISLDPHGLYDFRDSAEDMAQFLGFGESKYLEHFADQNDLVWGNAYGAYLFHNPRAFGKDYDDTFSLETIGLHWLKVADRYETSRKTI